MRKFLALLSLVALAVAGTACGPQREIGKPATNEITFAFRALDAKGQPRVGVPLSITVMGQPGKAVKAQCAEGPQGAGKAGPVGEFTDCPFTGQRPGDYRVTVRYAFGQAYALRGEVRYLGLLGETVTCWLERTGVPVPAASNTSGKITRVNRDGRGEAGVSCLHLVNGSAATAPVARTAAADPYQTYLQLNPRADLVLSREDAQTRAYLGCGTAFAPGTVDAVLAQAYRPTGLCTK